MKLWKRFTAWLHYLRHPCTIITMDEAPAKGVNVNFSYTGLAKIEDIRVYDRPLTGQEILQHYQDRLEDLKKPLDHTVEFWGHIEGEMPDPNILADMFKGAHESKESKDWPWKSPFEFGKPDADIISRLLQENEEDSMNEGKNEALDHVEECLDNLRTGIMIGLHPQEAALGQWGLESQIKVVENVKADFKKLQEAIKALRKEQHEQEDQEERPS